MEHRHVASGGNRGNHMTHHHHHHHHTASPDPSVHSHHYHHHHNHRHHPHVEETTTITTPTATAFGEYVASHTPHSDIRDSYLDMSNAKETGHAPHHHHHESHHLGNAFDPSDNHLDPSGGQTGGHGMHHGMGHMKPVFRWVTDVSVLFQEWTTATALELAVAMLTAAFLAAAYEWLRNWLAVWDGTQRPLSDMPRWKRFCLRSVRSLMHALTAAVSYLQMLFAMTYDLRIFVAIILGSSVGFFVLGPYFRRLGTERKGKRACAEGNGIYVDGSGKDGGLAELMVKEGTGTVRSERAEKLLYSAADGERGESELLKYSFEDRETAL